MNNLALIIGATGFIGGNLGNELKKNNWDIISVSRDIDKSKKYVTFANEHINITALNPDLISKADGVFIFAGAPIASKPLTKNYYKIVYDSRINLTKKIAKLIEDAPRKPKIVISASGTNYYGNLNELIATESTTQGLSPLAILCGDWERAASPISNHSRLIIARIGMVLDDKNGALPKMILPFKFFLGGKIGNGNNWIPWIHREDLINALMFCITNDIINGPVNFVAPNSVRMGEFIKILAQSLNRPAIFKIPSPLIKLIMRGGSEVLLSSIKAVPQKLIITGFQFKYKNIREALNSLLTNQ